MLSELAMINTKLAVWEKGHACTLQKHLKYQLHYIVYICFQGDEDELNLPLKKKFKKHDWHCIDGD